MLNYMLNWGKYCLGTNFQSGYGLVRMSQSTYIKELLDHFGITNAKPVSCPMDVSIRLQKADKFCEDEFPYRELIGGLMYLATSTRPAIANSVCQLSQFLYCFNKAHWTAAKYVLRYLKKTINFGLMFKNTIDLYLVIQMFTGETVPMMANHMKVIVLLL